MILKNNGLKNLSNKESFRKIILKFTLLTFLTARIIFAIYTATSGVNLSDLESKIEEISKENYILQNSLASSSSLKDVSERSLEMGYGQPSNIVYLKLDEAFAKAP